MAPIYLQDFCKSRPRDVTPYAVTPWVFSRFLTPAWCKIFGDRAFAVAVPRFWNSRPLAITESDSIDNENANMARVCFLRILGRFWFQTLESKILDPTCCIRLVTFFDTFQQRPTMLDEVGSVWPGLYGLMKRYWKYSHRDTN